MSIRFRLPAALLALTLGFASQAHASFDSAAPAYEAPERIQSAAFALLAQDNPAAQPGDVAIDANLRLPACPDPELTAAWVREGTVEVGCASSGWRLFVPIRAARKQTVLVLARPIAAGAPVSELDLRVEERDTTRITPSALADVSAIAGRVARRGLAAGSVLTAGDLVAERSVRRGDEVTLLARSGGIVVRARGKALGEGGAQDLVRVENAQSRRVVTGRILDSGEVEVLN